MSHEIAVAAKAHSQHRLIDIVWGPEASAAPLLPQHIDYRDSLSGDFQLTAACVASRPDLDTSALLGRSIGVGLISAQGRRRWLTGIITGAHRAGLHGGLPQVNLQIGSALALLAHRHACRVFQDISVPDIVALILDEHRHRNPRIAAAFEHTRQLLREHPPRSYCVQFNESDHAFMERLLAEEGISYHFHFSVDQLQPRHCLHLSDSSLFDPDRARPLRYRNALTEDRDDDLQQWQERHHLVPSTVTLSSYDYASAQVQQGSDDAVLDRELPASDATLGLQAHEAQTLYYASGNQDLDRYARLRMQARELRARTWLGEGQLRTLVTGDAVTIEQHPLHAAQASAGRSFLVTGIHLEACNNLPDAVPAGDGEGLTPGQCRTRFRAVPHDQTVVPAYADRLHRPTANGPQTATVVGPPGETVHTDALGRIRICFHWQRPQDHPDGHTEDARASTWVRVALPSAGDGFGHQFLPRIGQEVLVTFLHGDIDRPVVTGVLYNGRHATPRFAGVGHLPGNRALSGIRSQEHAGDAHGELIFDDSTGQLATTLRASPHDSVLHLGHLHGSRSDDQADPRGEGAELRTDAALALRSAHGLLVSSHGRQQAQGHQLDRQELQGLLDDCRRVFEDLATLAIEQQAGAPATAPQQALAEALRGWGDQGGQAPVIAVSAAAGLVSATPASQLHVSQGHHDVVATGGLQQTSGERMHLQAGQGLSLFARDGGISTIANAGHVAVQARTAEIQAHALQGVQISAENGEIVLAAPVIRLVAADGSFLRVGGGVTGGSKDAIAFHGASHDWDGPRTEQWQRTLVAAPIPPVCLPCLAMAAMRGSAAVNLAGAA